jgi:hypothetical protein
MRTERHDMNHDLALIPHRVDGQVIEQRRIDGYVDATAMCRAVGKQFNDYSRLGSSKAYLSELEIDTGIPVSELIQSVRGGSSSAQGTWIHPKVALHLAQWLSPRFAVQVSNWIYDWMTGRVSPPVHRMPYHLRRYLKNRSHVPDGHFSMLTEMIQSIIAPMEEAGYTLPERMLPDIFIRALVQRDASPGTWSGHRGDAVVRPLFRGWTGSSGTRISGTVSTRVPKIRPRTLDTGAVNFVFPAEGPRGGSLPCRGVSEADRALARESARGASHSRLGRFRCLVCGPQSLRWTAKGYGGGDHSVALIS